MAGLMGNKEISVNVLDQLQQFSDLIKSITNNDNLSVIISDLKDQKNDLQNKYNDFQTLKLQQDNSASILARSTSDNNQSIIDLQKAKDDSSQAKKNADASISKSQSLLKSLDQAQADYDEKTRAGLADIAQKTKDLADAQEAVRAAQDAADALKSEYDEKINNLKKLTG